MPATGELQASAVGAGNAAAAGENAVTQRRTSRSMLLQRELLARQPQLQQLASRLQERAQKLLHTGTHGADVTPYATPCLL
jgi:hypothetical protein